MQPVTLKVVWIPARLCARSLPPPYESQRSPRPLPVGKTTRATLRLWDWGVVWGRGWRDLHQPSKSTFFKTFFACSLSNQYFLGGGGVASCRFTRCISHYWWRIWRSWFQSSSALKCSPKSFGLISHSPLEKSPYTTCRKGRGYTVSHSEPTNQPPQLKLVLSQHLVIC